MKIDWAPLRDELARFGHDGIALPLWWRDDDAVSDTTQLHELAARAAALGLEVYTAVIPDRIDVTLAPQVAALGNLVPVVHGWRHISHAPQGEKNAEFGHLRGHAATETGLARARMQEVFGEALLSMFVPPWNRITPDLLMPLAQQGYCAVSTYGPRSAEHPVSGLRQINTHIDPIFWRGDRGLVAPEQLVATLCETLKARRTGKTDPAEPLGLLTHHLVHTPEIWSFCTDLMGVLLDGGAVPADLRKMRAPDASGGAQP